MKVRAKYEMKKLSEAGVETVSLNGWTESVDYVSTLDIIVKLEDGVYETI